MADPESSDSPQVKLLREWGRGFQTRDLGLIAKALHKDYRYVTSPKSIGRPEETREEWLERYAGVLSLWSVEPEPAIHATIDAPGKVITHVTNKTKTSVGVEMTRESIIITDFVTDEDGSLKIRRTEEFTDSKVYLDFYQAIAAAKKQ